MTGAPPNGIAVRVAKDRASVEMNFGFDGELLWYGRYSPEGAKKIIKALQEAVEEITQVREETLN